MTDALPIVDACWVSETPGAGYVMAREDGEPMEAARRFPIVRMIDGDGEDTDQPAEAKVVVFGSDEFGWCVYTLDAVEPEVLQ